MNGINSPYEAPETPNYIAEAGEKPMTTAIDELISLITRRE
jgi:adenylylsulfate kinase-like enzyme